MNRSGLKQSVWLITLALNVLPATGQPILTEPRETLQGLTGVALVIEPIPIAGRARGLRTEDIRQDVTTLLEEAGLAVLTAEERSQTRRSPALYVQVTLFDDASKGVYAFHVRLSLEQLVALQTGEPGEFPLAYASTWDTGATGTIPVTQVAALRQVVRDLVMQFIKDWAQ